MVFQISFVISNKRTVVVLAECIRVDSVEATYSEERVTLDKLLPLSLQNEHVLLVVPAFLSHAGQDIWMWLDDDVHRGRTVGMGLEERVNLRISARAGCISLAPQDSGPTTHSLYRARSRS